ncbi:MAG TPA: hypothetical protein DCZ95_12355 [Verrucomicrobia bacterium]|nr:MAG: hypothetical protein A2X46_14400 [Lentisphaerae bacterium GWF2_57_35]HBA84877.1 hypothetical protein [Verrucomicrobiota bacterium]
MELAAASATARTQAASTSNSSTTEAGGAMGKNEFLKLLTTQMKSQDPLNPMDSTAMIAELAQFSALEQMQNLNQQFEGFRRDNGLALSYMLGGQEVSLALNTGETVQGLVDQIVWEDNEAKLQMNDTLYPLSSIISLQKVMAEETEEAAADETPAT